MTQDLIIDGSNMLHRVYWIATSNKNAQVELIDGLAPGPVYLFLRSTKSLIEKFKPQKTWIVWDRKLQWPSTNFRKRIAGETYKQNRDPSHSEDVFKYLDVLTPWVESLGIAQLYPNVLEADDVIAWLAMEKSKDCVLVSADKDLLQLISPTVKVYNPIKKIVYDKENFYSSFEVEAKDYAMYKAIIGDKSDNIEGLKGYGPVKAKKLMKTTDFLNTLEDADRSRLSNNITLIDLHGSYKLEEGETEVLEKQFSAPHPQINIEEFTRLCEHFKFYSFLKEIRVWKNLFAGDILTSKLTALFT